MPKTKANDVEIEYKTIGDSNSKPLLLIAGLGSQMYAWSDEMCNNLVNKGFFVIRFDNRDVGLSTKFGQAGIPDFSANSENYKYPTFFSVSRISSKMIEMIWLLVKSETSYPFEISLNMWGVLLFQVLFPS